MAKKKAETKKVFTTDYRVLIKPIITEKSSAAGGSGVSVVFKVAPQATKPIIKAAVERIFDVEVANIRTCHYRGKLKRIARAAGRRAAYKKAYVTLKEGHTIDIVEGL